VRTWNAERFRRSRFVLRTSAGLAMRNRRRRSDALQE
jgi:hypothetical protein